MARPFTPPSIVVGVDGSRAGVSAALWAIDEAVGRDLPLRLVAAGDTPGDTTGDTTGDTAGDTAEAAVGAAAAAVRQTGRPVTVSTDVIAGRPAPALLEASRGAAMVCVGAVGLKHFDHPGSTALALVNSAHCPVAVVRGAQRPAGDWVVVELDQTPDSATVLQYAVEEARMRSAPLRVLGVWQSDEHGAAGTVHAQLDRRLEQWRHRYPDLDVMPLAVPGSGLSYLADNAADIQLVVVGAGNTASTAELLGPPGMAALHDTGCSILVVDRQRLL